MTFVRLPIERAGAQTGQGAQGSDAIQQLTTLRHGSQNNIQPAHGLPGKAKRGSVLISNFGLQRRL
ncbi:MAG: hypothetical protein DME22_11325 [Verrucomicrobia bacterium]|nr:MAG: hypothetical protein DME22_11325 [Verrucomicrobiota bacterium]